MINLDWVKEYIDIADEDLKELAVKITKAGINVDKKTLRSLEGIDKNTFYQRLQQIAPNFNDEQVAEAFKHVTLANNSNPKSEFLSATIGAGIGLGLAAATDYYQDSANYINAQNVETDGVDTSTTSTSEICAPSRAGNIPLSNASTVSVALRETLWCFRTSLRLALRHLR